MQVEKHRDPRAVLEHSNMKMQRHEEELAKVGGNPGTCGELKAKWRKCFKDEKSGCDRCCYL